ncbi:glycoside hydrolase family 16 protein [Geodermatophilus nigrescens]|uniref:Glycosyl hydrolases family 16 n=1 Tax=Geodermatophilus nigrescens TaxID=1070870 RepID=A0A1M5D4N5_9ACTN|nr:glycoside hydrolase family 16 protein [Geodermatophilus nigrescens]SHF61800.1 Glycosyl hydrolases family 16 [Geodermatophilus nigrescens]
MQPTWADEFDSLDLASGTNPNGFWRANDVWQPIDAGYAGFDGDTPGTWFLNPAQDVAGSPRSPFSVSDGVLSITASRTPASWRTSIAELNTQNPGYAPPWTGGILLSNTDRPDATFGYGYYEFRMRTAAPVQGGWPALWFFAADGQNPGHEQAEIDLFEVFGHPDGQPWTVTVHQAVKVDGRIGPAPGARTATGQIDVASVDADTTAWHVYALDWQPGQLRFLRDGVVVGELTGADAAFFDGVRMSIRLNVAMDGSWFPEGQRSQESSPDRWTMEVDYIRRWDDRPA